MTFFLLLAALIVLLYLGIPMFAALFLLPLGVRAQRPDTAGERRPFQAVLLVPPDDKDYVITRIPEGMRAVLTDVIAFNAADGKARRVSPSAESYLWIGGYVDRKPAGLINRMRVLGNDPEQWHLQTGMELRGAPELVATCEKGVPNESPVLLHVTGYLTR